MRPTWSFILKTRPTGNLTQYLIFMAALRATFVPPLKKVVVVYVKKNPNLKTTKNPIAEDHCHLTRNFRWLAYDKCILIKRKKYVSIEPMFCHYFSGYDCHLKFEKASILATEKSSEPKINDIIANSSKKLICRNGRFKIPGFF